MIIPSIILIFNFLCFTFGKHHSYLHRNLHYKKNGIHYGNLRFGINLEQKTFIKDNQPFRYISGEVHYFRIHPSLWGDRLQRIRHLGLNAIQVYVPWNYHEQIPGIIDFESESRNLSHFLKLAYENDLHVLLRIGPYVCAEWENGGLPWWLLKTPNISMRTSDKNFIKPVFRYFDVLLPILRNNLYINTDEGVILMIQIENEYGSLGKCDKLYMKQLSDYVYLHLSNEVTLYTTDGSNKNLLDCGTIDGVFATIDFGSKAKDIQYNFDLQQSLNNGGPCVNSEFYTTWFSLWGNTDLPKQDSFKVIQALNKMNKYNASFSFYMIHGGTNFEFWNGAEVNGPVLTSYDYAAPISESGDITQLYMSIRHWIQSLPNWPQKPLNIPSDLTPVSITDLQINCSVNLITAMKKLIDVNKCLSSELPLPFEYHALPYTFVLYTTVLNGFDRNNNKNVLTVKNVKNIGYVFLDDVFQGFVSSLCHLPNHSEWCISSIYLNWMTSKGRHLSILVENTARVTFETIVDLKGIFGEVKVNNQKLTRWVQCGVDFSRLSLRKIQKILEIKPYEEVNGPSIHLSKFKTAQISDWSLYHTYFDARNWGKGFVILNGFNLGRYWSNLGPQMTLYTPGQAIHTNNNILIIVELMGYQNNWLKKIKDNKNYSSPEIQFIDYSIYQHNLN